MARARVYKTTRLSNGKKVVVSQSIGEAFATDFFTGILTLLWKLIVFCFKLAFSPLFFFYWLYEKIVAKKDEAPTIWVYCGGVVCIWYIVSLILSLNR